MPAGSGFRMHFLGKDRMKDTCVRPCGASPNTIYQSTKMTEWMLLFHRFAYNAYRTPTKLHGSRKAVFQGNVRTHSRSYCCSKSNETENNVRKGRFIQLYYFVKRALAAHHLLLFFNRNTIQHTCILEEKKHIDFFSLSPSLFNCLRVYERTRSIRPAVLENQAV